MIAADTIAAPATAPGPAAVGMVRISGPQAFAVAGRVCRRWPAVVDARRAVRTAFQRDGAVFDEGIALPFVGPASYTGEDLVELHGHGGHALRVLLDAVLAAGARIADPGEFSQRAYLNGKLDLAQAEAVAQLITAQTDRALRVARAALGGSVSREVEALERALGALRGRVEGILDFEAESAGAEVGLDIEVRALSAWARRLADGYRSGRRLFARSEVVLAGPVNAGKSSLFNALCGEDRALVDASPGTTRDLVTADWELDGMPLRLCDSAGWRDAVGVEARGIEKGRDAAQVAALVLWVCPAGSMEPPPDAGWLRVAAKVDLAPKVRLDPGVVPVSVVAGTGLSALRAAISARLMPGADEEIQGVTERQAMAFGQASEALERASGTPELELAAEELALASRALATVRGEGIGPEVIDEVFRQFCIGK